MFHNYYLSNENITILKARKNIYILLLCRKKVLALCIMYYLFLSSLTLLAQEKKYSFIHLSNKNGLSENYINNIMQDKSGLIWISTANGMNVFDGTHIIKFDRSSFKTALNNGTKASYIDSKNRLWLSSKGLYCLDLNSKTRKEFLHDEKDPKSITSNKVTKIAEDKKGNIWVGTRRGICRMSFESSKFTNYHFDKNKDTYEEYDNNRIFDFVFDSKGFIWINSLGGLKKFNKHNNTFEYQELPYGLSHKRIKALSIDNNDNLWLNVNDSVLLNFNTITQKGICYDTKDKFNAPSSKVINQIYCDRANNIWLATDNGLNKFDKRLQQFLSYKNDFFNSESIADNYIISIFEDKSGLIWIGTASSGVDRMCVKTNSFEHIGYNPYITGGLKGKNIYRILPNEDKLWLVSSEGIELFDTKSKKTIHKKITQQTGGLNIESIALDRKNILWLGCVEGLFKYDCKTENFARVNTYRLNNPTQTIFDIKPMEDGSLWLGTSLGLVIYNPKSDKLKHRYNDSTLAHLPYLFALKFEQFEPNNIIISYSNGGILHCNKEAKIIKKYPKNISEQLRNLDIIDVKVGKKKQIYLSSGKGLFVIYGKNIKKYDVESGLPSNHIFSISIDSNDHVWTSTDNGLSKFNTQDHTFTNYSTADGLQSMLFLGRSAAVCENGDLYFGGINGLNVYKPQIIASSKYDAPIRLISFSCQGKEIFSQSISDSLILLNLGSNQNNISFEFSSLYFENPEQVNYAYMLEGYDADWNNIGNRMYGSYTNLPAGNYVLKIKSRLQNGNWSPQIKKIQILISAPFWKTIWFLLPMLSIIILTLYIFYSYRIKRIKQEEKRKTEINKQLSEVKLLALKAQMTPHFIFNSISAIQHFIIDEQNKNALLYLSKFSKLLRIVLNNANENKNTIQKEIEFLNLYLELQSIRFENKFKYEITLENNFEIEIFEIPILLLQPFVENAIEHGILNKDGNGFIQIRFYKTDTQIICELEDDGIGREKAIKIKTEKKASYHSLGIKISEERVNTIAQLQKSQTEIEIIDLYNKNGDASGTLVKISLALNKNERID